MKPNPTALRRAITLACLLGTCSLGLSISPMAYAASKDKSRAILPHLPPIATINPIKTDEKADGLDTVDPLEPVSLAAVANPTANKAAVNLSAPVTRLDNSIAIREKDTELEALNALQKSVTEEDLKILWGATVENNPVIRFSLEKLAMPQDLHAKHSSRFLTKTLNALVTGAVLGSSMLPGGGYYRQMGAMAGGDIVRNLVNGNTKPTGEVLTATEQIQLASLVDELKGRLIQTYHDYKHTLQHLSNAHEAAIKNNALYAEALQGPDPLSKVAAASAYYKSLMQETQIRQKAKLYRMQLERMAGRDSVNTILLTAKLDDSIMAYVPNTPTTPTSNTHPARTVNRANVEGRVVPPQGPIGEPSISQPATSGTTSPSGTGQTAPRTGTQVKPATPQIKSTPTVQSIPAKQPATPSPAPTPTAVAQPAPITPAKPVVQPSQSQGAPGQLPKTVKPAGNQKPTLKDLYNESLLMEYR